MYVNYSFAAKKQITVKTITHLQLISQNKFEDLSSIIEQNLTTDDLNELEQKGLITHIKKKKVSETVYNTVRLSDKGKELLELITTPSITPLDLEMFNYFSQLYLAADEERKIGNKKKCLQYIAEFRQLLNWNIYEMYWLCELYCKEAVYTKILELVFFDRKSNPYGNFKNSVESSKLYQFYEENKARIHQYWAAKIKTE